VVTPATALSKSPWRSARWLVLAPHADDETLGTGALIADTAARNRLAGVMILTDGSGSHSCPTPANRSALIRRRRGEARHAVALLTGGRRITPRFLDWHDANPHRPGSAAFRRSVRQLAALLRRHAVDAIATTAAGEPHCDHAACFTLAVQAALAARRPVAIFEYAVWGERPEGKRVVRTTAMPIARRSAALRAHRSQLTGLMGDGFRLPRAQQRMPGTDLLYLANRHATRP
jgi:LmbE family N-acetylglucosaminyl deacetylase